MDIISKINQYYTNKIKEHGTNNLGVDWNSKESQFLRFEQLSKVIFMEENISVLDFGCGYGAYIEYLQNYLKKFEYLGFDISDEMIDNAKKNYLLENVFFTTKKENLKPCDYVIASGIFNVKLDVPITEWEEYIKKTLNELNSLSIKGFSFNLLTSYSDKEFMKDYLYYGNPCFYFDYCKNNFSNNVALLHDYNLYEFTILVKKI